MVILIETYYEHAQLSDAASALLEDGMSDANYRNALVTRGFTQAEATTFAGQFSIVKTLKILPPVSSGALSKERHERKDLGDAWHAGEMG
jgi:hypothetical protein